MSDGRDFVGYGAAPPDPRWPGGARVAVSLVLNIEEGAELSLSSGDERNESEHELDQELVGHRDHLLESHFEYGPRAGWWRVARLLERHGATATVNACARALERTPWLGRDAVARGYEVMCHGWRWEDQHHLGIDEERALIARCVASIERTCGERPVGWYVRSHPSENTRHLLAEEGGFVHDSNAYNDDLPYLADVPGHPLVVVPYSLDTNDMRFFPGRGFGTADDFATYCGNAFDWLHDEGGRMMTIGLHPRIIGRPGRIAGLDRFLTHLRERGGAWIARRDEIARHWLASST